MSASIFAKIKTILVSFLLLFSTLSSADEFGKRWKLGVDFGYEKFSYDETYANSSTKGGVQGFHQSGFRMGATFSRWLIPARIEFVGEGSASISANQVSDHGEPVQLFKVSAGINSYWKESKKFHFILGAGFSEISMRTPSRSFGFYYLRGPWIQTELMYDVAKNSIPMRLSFIPRISTLSTSSKDALNFSNKEISLGGKARIPWSVEYPTFNYARAFVLSVYYNRMNYFFSDAGSANTSYSDLILMTGIEF